MHQVFGSVREHLHEISVLQNMNSLFSILLEQENRKIAHRGPTPR